MSRDFLVGSETRRLLWRAKGVFIIFTFSRGSRTFLSPLLPSHLQTPNHCSPNVAGGVRKIVRLTTRKEGG